MESTDCNHSVVDGNINWRLSVGHFSEWVFAQCQLFSFFSFMGHKGSGDSREKAKLISKPLPTDCASFKAPIHHQNLGDLH